MPAVARDVEFDPRGRGLLLAVSGVLVLALLGSGVFGANGVRQHERLRSQLADLTARLEHAERENERLEAEAKALRGSPAYVGWVIRQELGWTRPGERILRLDP